MGSIESGGHCSDKNPKHKKNADCEKSKGKCDWILYSSSKFNTEPRFAVWRTWLQRHPCFIQLKLCGNWMCHDYVTVHGEGVLEPQCAVDNRSNRYVYRMLNIYYCLLTLLESLRQHPQITSREGKAVLRFWREQLATFKTIRDDSALGVFWTYVEDQERVDFHRFRGTLQKPRPWNADAQQVGNDPELARWFQRMLVP